MKTWTIYSLMPIPFPFLLASACGVAALTGCPSDTDKNPSDSGTSKVDSGLDPAAVVDSGASSDPATNHDAGPAAVIASLTDATWFRVDSSGTNLNTTSDGHIGHGVWTTHSVQNIPGNWVVRFFLATSADPGPTDLFPLATQLSAALSSGANKFYLFADGDDMQGGNYGFGLNLWLNGAKAGSPSISTFVGTGDDDPAFAANGTTGCTPGLDAVCTPGSNALSWTQGGHTVTLTSFSISAVGGAAASASCVDKVGADNTSAAVTNMPNGSCDNVASFTLTVQ